MIIHESLGEPQMVSINGAPPTSMRQKLATFKVVNDDDMKELSEEMAKGRDVIFSVQGENCGYALVREFITSKIQLSSLPKDIIT